MSGGNDHSSGKGIPGEVRVPRDGEATYPSDLPPARPTKSTVSELAARLGRPLNVSELRKAAAIFTSMAAETEIAIDAAPSPSTRVTIPGTNPASNGPNSFSTAELLARSAEDRLVELRAPIAEALRTLAERDRLVGIVEAARATVEAVEVGKVKREAAAGADDDCG